MLSLSEVISCWKVSLRELGTQRYVKSNRPEYIGNLIEMFLFNNIDYETAKTAKKQVIDILTTEEGKKAKGKHKDWGINISDEYIAQLCEAYPQNPGSLNKNIESFEFMLSWLESYLNDSVLFSNLKQCFFEKILQSDWIKTGENAPSWAIKFYQSSILTFDLNKNKPNESYPKEYFEPTFEKEESEDLKQQESLEESDSYHPDPFDFEEDIVLEPDDDPNRPPMIDKETWEKLKIAPFNPTLILK